MCQQKVNQRTHDVLRDLANDESIKICKYDKGNGVVILNTTDYFKKLDEIVLDKEKFSEVKVDDDDLKHPIIKNEHSICYFLRTHVKQYVSEKVFKEIMPSGSQPGKLYGLCKVHKDGFPLRPVVSMIGTAEYNIAKYLDKLIKPFIPSTHMLNSTISFLDSIKNFVFSSKDKLVSYDVVSLFTNVPLKDTIDIICDTIYDKDTNDKPPMPKHILKRLLVIATGGLFLHNGKLYKTIDGVTMGSPLAPTLANFILAHFESKLLKDTSIPLPALYLRYVDDIFCVFRVGVDPEPFFRALNSLHINLKFTMEHGNKSLAFLDTQISLPENDSTDAVIDVFRKKTHTDLILNFNAVCPKTWKFGLIFCLLNRAYNVCSSWSLFDIEVMNLKRMFSLNGYPKELFDNCVSKFLYKKYEPVTKRERDTDGIVFCIPYFGHPSIQFKKKLIAIFNKYYNLKVNVVFKSFKVGSYFSLKFRTPFALSANVVYKYHCSCDTNMFYIGKTKRHLVQRAKEHQTSGAIFNHNSVCNFCHSVNLSKFKIIDRANSDLELKIKEALHIKMLSPCLNSQLFQNGSEFILSIF